MGEITLSEKEDYYQYSVNVVNKSKYYAKITGFDTSNVTNMSQMFEYLNSLTNIDLRGFNTTKVTAMSYMFNECTALESLDIRNATFGAVTKDNAFNGMYAGVPNNALITVKNSDVKNIILEINSNLTNIVVAGQ